MTAAQGALPSVGIIGVGQMGSAMAERLVQMGHRVSAYDPRPQTGPRLASIGAAPAANATEVAREADIVVLMVLDSSQAEEAIWGTDGFAAGATPASVLCVGSSLPASYLADLAARATGRFRLVDSPVSGGVEGARAGTLTFMVAGAEDAVAAAQPLYDALGSRMHRLGTAPGLAATMKAINQAMFLSSLASAAEMVVAGAKAGLSPETIIEVVSHSSGDSWALRNRIPLSWRNGYVSGGSLAVMDKDIRTALALAEDLGVDARVVRAAGLAVQEAYDRHSGTGDDPMIIETIEARSGTRPGRAHGGRMSPSPLVVVLSDDLTGAVAAAGEARRAGSTAEVTAWDTVPRMTDAQVLVVDTNSRLLPPDEARRRVRDLIQLALERFGDAVMYKRIDTLLRGNTGEEVRAWREAIAVPAVLVPAAPACGIATGGGRQLRRGEPIEVSPSAPDASRTQPQGLLAAMPFGLGDVKAATFRRRLQEVLRQGKDVLLDASDEADIRQIAQGAAREHAAGTQFGLVGSYGFLGAWIEARLAPAPSRAGGALVVASSYQPSTLRQMEALARRTTAVVVDGTSGEPMDLRLAVDGLRDGRDVAIVTTHGAAPAEPSAAAAHTAAAMAGEVLRQATPTGLVLLGGEVSSALVRLLAPRRLAVACEPWPATPVMRLEGGPHDGLLAVIQSGSQGEPGRTIHAIDLLAALRTERPHTRGARAAGPSSESRGAHA